MIVLTSGNWTPSILVSLVPSFRVYFLGYRVFTYPCHPRLIIVGTGRKLVNTMEHDYYYYYYSRQRGILVHWKTRIDENSAGRVFREDWPSSRKLDENVMNAGERGLCYFKRWDRATILSYGQQNRGKATHNRWNRKVVYVSKSSLYFF